MSLLRVTMVTVSFERVGHKVESGTKNIWVMVIRSWLGLGLGLGLGLEG